MDKSVHLNSINFEKFDKIKHVKENKSIYNQKNDESNNLKLPKLDANTSFYNNSLTKENIKQKISFKI
jgi:hypothetical protein